MGETASMLTWRRLSLDSQQLHIPRGDAELCGWTGALGDHMLAPVQFAPEQVETSEHSQTLLFHGSQGQQQGQQRPQDHAQQCQPQETAPDGDPLGFSHCHH